MGIDDFSVHDSQISEVKETPEQTIDFCTDWQNNVLEKRNFKV